MDSDHEDQGSCVWHGCDLPEGLLTPCLLDSRVLHHVPDSNPKKLQVVSLLQSLGLPVSSWSCLRKLRQPSTTFHRGPEQGPGLCPDSRCNVTLLHH